jgi:hypothetical protein
LSLSLIHSIMGSASNRTVGLRRIFSHAVYQTLQRWPTVILSGWKEIAKYLNSGVRTSQRWETSGLPVRRPVRSKRSPVLAQSEDIDRWLHNSAFIDGNGTSDAVRGEQQQLCLEMRRKIQTLQHQIIALRKEIDTIRGLGASASAGTRTSPVV